MERCVLGYPLLAKKGGLLDPPAVAQLVWRYRPLPPHMERAAFLAVRFAFLAERSTVSVADLIGRLTAFFMVLMIPMVCPFFG